MPIYDSDNPYYVDSAFDSPSTGFVNIDPALRPEGLPPLSNCFMDLEGEFVMPNIKCMGGTFYDEVEFRGSISILDSVTVGTDVNVTNNLLVSGNLEVTGNLDVDGSLQLSSGTRVNSIQTTIGNPGTDDILVTEQAIREALNALQQSINSLEIRISVLENA